jgi:transcriptional regulator with XRE-family HTH domain
MEATALNERLRALMLHHRTTKGYSTRKMAQLLQLPEKRYRRIEGGAEPNITIAMVNAFCAALKIPVYRFLIKSNFTHPDLAKLVASQWELVCYLQETQEQLQQLVDLLEQNRAEQQPPATVQKKGTRMRRAS